MNNYRKGREGQEKGRRDLTFLNANGEAAPAGCGGEIVPSHSNEEEGNKEQQRAEESPFFFFFINCVGSRSCPLEKSTDLIKLPLSHSEGG